MGRRPSNAEEEPTNLITHSIGLFLFFVVELSLKRRRIELIYWLVKLISELMSGIGAKTYNQLLRN